MSLTFLRDAALAVADHLPRASTHGRPTAGVTDVIEIDEYREVAAARVRCPFARVVGAGFGATQSTSIVTFNGTAATPTAWSDTAITVPVPSGATSGPVVVTVNGAVSNGVAFTVTVPPTISSVTPDSSTVNQVVTIAGASFGATQGSSGLTFNGTPATPANWSDTSITASVPPAATTGPIVVIVNGLASNGIPFTIVPAGEVVEYVHTDALGSVRRITAQDGSVVSTYDYLPFGVNWPGTNDDANAVRFTGAERDPQTGYAASQALDYFGARYYQSQAGRFTAIDPGHVGGDFFDPQSWNAYAYALNNPLRFVDPVGTCSQDAKGNYVDADDGGTLVASGPCPRGKNGALSTGITETVSVKPGSSSADESTQPLLSDSLLLQPSNFAAGAGDALTGRMIPSMNTSLTEYVRNQMGTDGVVAKSSSSYAVGNFAGGTVGWTLAASASATAAAIANGKRGALFGRGTQTVFNSSKVRFGWGWDATVSPPRDVIRLGIGPARGTAWWSHIRFWYP